MVALGAVGSCLVAGLRRCMLDGTNMDMCGGRHGGGFPPFYSSSSSGFDEPPSFEGRSFPSIGGSLRRLGGHDLVLLTKRTIPRVWSTGEYDVRDSAAASSFSSASLSPCGGRDLEVNEPHLFDLSFSWSSTPVLRISVKTSRVWFGVGCTLGGLSAWACEVYVRGGEGGGERRSARTHRTRGRGIGSREPTARV